MLFVCANASQRSINILRIHGLRKIGQNLCKIKGIVESDKFHTNQNSVFSFSFQPTTIEIKNMADEPEEIQVSTILASVTTNEALDAFGAGTNADEKELEAATMNDSNNLGIHLGVDLENKMKSYHVRTESREIKINQQRLLSKRNIESGKCPRGHKLYAVKKESSTNSRKDNFNFNTESQPVDHFCNYCDKIIFTEKETFYKCGKQKQEEKELDECDYKLCGKCYLSIKLKHGINYFDLSQWLEKLPKANKKGKWVEYMQNIEKKQGSIGPESKTNSVVNSRPQSTKSQHSSKSDQVQTQAQFQESKENTGSNHLRQLSTASKGSDLINLKHGYTFGINVKAMATKNKYLEKSKKFEAKAISNVETISLVFAYLYNDYVTSSNMASVIDEALDIDTLNERVYNDAIRLDKRLRSKKMIFSFKFFQSLKFIQELKRLHYSKTNVKCNFFCI